jgi:peptidoglycan/xylan/chitin deacetylase (PgdA/CDA1 family)
LNFFKKRSTAFILGWNGVLSIALLLLIFFRPAANSVPIENDPTTKSESGERSAEIFSQLSTQSIDSLVHSGLAQRREILRQKTYTLDIPLEKGSVITIWQNNWPVMSEVVRAKSVKHYPIALKYDNNRIRVGVWNGQQQLVYEDYFEITYRNALVEALRYPVVRGKREMRQVSLTFDGGSSDNGAREILRILAEKKITTTIFLTGQFIEKYPELVLEILQAGHEIGNHTYNHPHLTTYAENHRHDTLPGVNREFVQHQLLRTDSLFFALTGKHMVSFWRAAYGEYNQDILDWAAEVGFRHIGWTNGFDTFDWVHDEASSLFKKPEDMHRAIIKKDDEKNSLDGAIVLMHLGTDRESGQMYTMLGGLIDDLVSRGFAPVSVTKLLNP